MHIHSCTDTHIYKINTTIYTYAHICIYIHTHIFYLYKFETWRLERPFQMRYLGDMGVRVVPWLVKAKENDPPDSKKSAIYFIHVLVDGGLVLNMR